MRRVAFFFLGLILAGIAGQPVRADLVTNGNFATGDFTGWTLSDASIYIDETYTPPYNADVYDAQFEGTGILSQNLATTVGQAYTLSFSLLDEAGLNADTFVVNFGGFTTTITGDTAATYQPEVFSIAGSDITGTSTTLSFQGFNATQNWNLDDVSVIAAEVPEPPAGTILAGAVILTLSLRLRGRTVPTWIQQSSSKRFSVI
jgi:hypothetical protein